MDVKQLREYDLRMNQNTKISLTKNYSITVIKIKQGNMLIVYDVSTHSGVFQART